MMESSDLLATDRSTCMLVDVFLLFQKRPETEEEAWRWDQSAPRPQS